MALSSVWKLDKVVIAGFEFSVVGNARVAPEIESMLVHPAGHPFPMFRAHARMKPLISFSTRQINTVLANIGSGGLEVTSDTFLYFKLATVTGSVARATTSHRRFRVPLSLAFWTTARLPHNGGGEIDVVVAASYDGSNEPIIPTSSVALSGNLAAGDHFGAGPCAINGAAQAGIQDITVNSGLREMREGGESELFDTFVAVEMGQPTIELSFLNSTALHTYALQGTVLNGTTGIVAYGRKFSPNGGRVANVTAEHLYFQGLLGSIVVVEDAADGVRPAVARIRAELVASSDSVLPLVTAVNQAIS
jgi:hypothetical protein